jgi:hypothetical protein
MKPEKNKSAKKEEVQNTEPEQKISRKEAIKKTGYVALSAATMMLLLSKPENAQAQSSPAPPSVW